MPMDGWYSWHLVLLSILIASLASYTALDLAGRVTAARGRERLAWLLGGSLALGTGIWSMHFIGMLAFHLPVPIVYQVGLVLLSVLVAIAASALALVVVSRPVVRAGTLTLAALWMGPAIAGMHYVGMAALRVPAHMSFDGLLVAASVAIAVAASWVGLALAYRFRADESPGGRLRRLASAVVLGCAIAGMHYTGMAAASFTGDGAGAQLSRGVLATRGLVFGVSLGTLAILGLGLFGAMADRWLRARAELEDRRRQSQKLEAVGQLAGGIAHDFNNLLTAIIGHTELLRPVLVPGSEAWSDLEEIRAAAERAAELTRQLLAFGRKQVLQPVVLDLNEEVSSMLRMLERLLGANFELRFVPRPGVGAVRVDRGQLDQVIMNLVVNARDAMLPGGGKIMLETDDVVLEAPMQGQLLGTAPGRYVVLSITDTGVGMSPETQARIFEPFFSTKAMGAGTGLGLATVYGVVKQSGGTVSVYSEPGRGSTFKVYFPVATGDAVSAEASGALRAAGGSETLLVVEDNPRVRNFVVRTLSSKGYTVLVAESAAEGLLKSETHLGPIAALLTDVVLPDRSGPALAQDLTQRRPGIRVLLMSGFAEEAVTDARWAFIQKPFSQERLAAKVREVLAAPVT